MGEHKHGEMSAKAKSGKKYSAENRLSKNRKRRADSQARFIAKKQAEKIA